MQHFSPSSGWYSVIGYLGPEDGPLPPTWLQQRIPPSSRGFIAPAQH